MAGLLQSFLISSRSDNKYGRQGQFLCFWLANVSPISSETTWPNGTKHGERSFTKFPHFVQIGQQIWSLQVIIASDLLIFQKSCPLTQPCQMESNMVGSILGRSFTMFPHFVLIRQQSWLQQAMLVSDCLIFQKSSLKPLGLWNQTIQETSMGGPLQSFLLLSRLEKKYGCHGQFLFLIGWYFRVFSCETTWPNGNKHGRSFTKFPHFVPTGQQILPPRAILVSDWLIF